MEIERKYLVNNLPDIEGIECMTIHQAYINKKPEIRIRKKQKGDSKEYFLTIKGEGTISREEWEVSIDEDAFNNLLSKADCSIRKERFEIPLSNLLKAELDIFKEINNLILVEVEFPDIEMANSFIPPKWFGIDVTEDSKYKNKNLAYNNIIKK